MIHYHVEYFRILFNRIKIQIACRPEFASAVDSCCCNFSKTRNQWITGSKACRNELAGVLLFLHAFMFY